jgi:hypothetical protein
LERSQLRPEIGRSSNGRYVVRTQSIKSSTGFPEHYDLACFIREVAARSNNEREMWQKMIPIVRV